jgi:hypothetical protein
MIVRTFRSKHFVRMTVISLSLTAAYSPVIASQDAQMETGRSCNSSDNTASPCLSSGAMKKNDTKEIAMKEIATKEIPKTASQQAATLPDAPQAQDQNGPPGSSFRRQDQNSAVLFLPVATSHRLSFNEKFTIYTHQTFGPPAVIFPAFSAAMGMANPKSHYPHEWRDGAGAFGRLYGDSLAMAASQRTARFLAGLALHEDPRYLRSSSTNPLARTAHALAFTFVDKTDSGRNTIAFSNFAGALAGGFVGQAYLPHGYNDLTHAEQRIAFQFMSIAIQNVAAEFQPQWGPIARKLRIQKILPEWWVPRHDN